MEETYGDVYEVPQPVVPPERRDPYRGSLSAAGVMPWAAARCVTASGAATAVRHAGCPWQRAGEGCPPRGRATAASRPGAAALVAGRTRPWHPASAGASSGGHVS